MTLVDDYGRYEADPILLKNECFPRREDIRASEVQKLLDELATNQLSTFYKVAGKAFLQFTNWTERARYDSKYPPPPDQPDNFSCPKDNFSLSPTPTSSSTSEPSPKPSPNVEGGGVPAPIPPTSEERLIADVRDSFRERRATNAPTLLEAQAYFAALNEREKLDPPYSAAEVRAAWLSYDSVKQSGLWMRGKKQVGDWRSALMERIDTMREGENVADGKPQTAWEIKQQTEAIDAQIKKIRNRGSETASGWKPAKPEDRDELRDLERRKDELEKKQAGL